MNAFVAALTKFARLFRTKRPFKLTGPGWVFILYTIGVGAGAINTGNNLLYLVFGVFLGLMIASGFLSDLSLWGVQVDTTFPHSGMMGQTTSLFFSVSNTKKYLPSFSIILTIEGTLRGKNVQLLRHISLIQSSSTLQTRIEWAPPRRGCFELKNVRLSTRYPFGLLEKWWRLRFETKDRERFFITPAIHPVNFDQIPFEALGEDKSLETLSRGDSANLLDIRSYVPGDNPRRIHWKASAKRSPTLASGGWIVREMSQEQKEQAAFQLPSPSHVGDFNDKEIEQLVSFIVSAAAACRSAQLDVCFFLEDRSVRDESIFFALWDPRKTIAGELSDCLEKIPTRNNVSFMIDALKAYHVQNAD